MWFGCMDGETSSVVAHLSPRGDAPVTLPGFGEGRCSAPFAPFQGLQVDDEIVEFGSVNANNFQNLQNIATVVQHSEGVSSFLL